VPFLWHAEVGSALPEQTSRRRRGVWLSQGPGTCLCIVEWAGLPEKLYVIAGCCPPAFAHRATLWFTMIRAPRVRAAADP